MRYVMFCILLALLCGCDPDAGPLEPVKIVAVVREDETGDPDSYTVVEFANRRKADALAHMGQRRGSVQSEPGSAPFRRMAIDRSSTARRTDVSHDHHMHGSHDMPNQKHQRMSNLATALTKLREAASTTETGIKNSGSPEQNSYHELVKDSRDSMANALDAYYLALDVAKGDLGDVERVRLIAVGRACSRLRERGEFLTDRAREEMQDLALLLDGKAAA